MTREEELQHKLDEARAEAEALRWGIEDLCRGAFRARVYGHPHDRNVVGVEDLASLLDRVNAGGSAPYREHVADLEAKLAAALKERS